MDIANVQQVSLVKLSMEQPDALTVLLTGRGEKNYADLINRMAASKELDFDMICLKPKAGPNNQLFGSTMKYKQALLGDLVQTYKDADEIRVYEDRAGQYVVLSGLTSKLPSSRTLGSRAFVTFLEISTGFYPPWHLLPANQLQLK